jgi:hypothetical protein
MNHGGKTMSGATVAASLAGRRTALAALQEVQITIQRSGFPDGLLGH